MHRDEFIDRGFKNTHRREARASTKLLLPTTVERTLVYCRHLADSDGWLTFNANKAAKWLNMDTDDINAAMRILDRLQLLRTSKFDHNKYQVS
jgi:hypothetical protein